MTGLDAVAQAIAEQEGYGLPGSIPTLANNPGDLSVGDVGFGTMGKGITVFPDLNAGSDALSHQLNLILSGQSKNYSPDESISDIGATYSGGDPNWGANVAALLGVSPNASLSSVAGSSPATTSAFGGGFFQGFKNFISQTPGKITSDLFGGIETYIENGASRSVTVILGLIFITGAILALDKAQTVIKTVAKTAEAVA